MFADSLFDSWDNHSHRGWTTLASFAAQACAVGLLLLVPLLYTQGLPRLLLLARVVAPSVPPGPPPAPARGHRYAENSTTSPLLAPTIVPHDIPVTDDSGVADAPEIPSGLWVTGGTGPVGARNPVMDAFGNGLNPVPPPPPPPSARPPRISHMMEGNLDHMVQPIYPPLARAARIQGAVVLRAVISREGKVRDLEVLNGHPMLAQAALDAVRQWRYRPYYLNGEPVEVETRVTVNFILGGQ
jgi:periplasmic protein TonB